ncbi:hypothetical protein HYDPIDRAFT_33138 [Hydnomerulius pinastri MD-312]|uniref:Uncharacterized protein n=1 Tax=Hydnomerulius pinastri MD-312 TaxID=994086 RepID=A0A0C9W0Y9_9AGAM|nr:hypothetical protein HYDPIDRAFT_33138 [Hydnomerulius pinastri MD-312]
MSGTTKFTAKVTQAGVLSHWARIKAALAAPILPDDQLEYNKYLKRESRKAFQIAQNGDSEEEIGKFRQEDFSSDVSRLASNPWSKFTTDEADLPTNVDIGDTKTQWWRIYHKRAADAADAAKSMTSESIGNLLFQLPCTHCKKSPATCIVVYRGMRIARCERCPKDDCSALKEFPSIVMEDGTVRRKAMSWKQHAVQPKPKPKARGKIQLKTLEFVPSSADDSDDADKTDLPSTSGTSKQTAPQSTKGKGRAKDMHGDVHATEIGHGHSVYDPKPLHGKVGALKVNPRQPGEENVTLAIVPPLELPAGAPHAVPTPPPATISTDDAANELSSLMARITALQSQTLQQTLGKLSAKIQMGVMAHCETTRKEEEHDTSAAECQALLQELEERLPQVLGNRLRLTGKMAGHAAVVGGNFGWLTDITRRLAVEEWGDIGSFISGGTGLLRTQKASTYKDLSSRQPL